MLSIFKIPRKHGRFIWFSLSPFVSQPLPSAVLPLTTLYFSTIFLNLNPRNNVFIFFFPWLVKYLPLLCFPPSALSVFARLNTINVLLVYIITFFFFCRSLHCLNLSFPNLPGAQTPPLSLCQLFIHNLLFAFNAKAQACFLMFPHW